MSRNTQHVNMSVFPLNKTVSLQKEIMDISKLEKTLSTMKSNEFDEILDMRDSQKFDSAWCQVFDVVDGVEIEFDRESLFRKISEATSHHEITSYIIDDFELLAKSRKVGVSSDFVVFLRESYEENKVPHVWQS